MNRRAIVTAGMILALILGAMRVFALDVAKPKVAVFPLGGTATEDLRGKCGFSLRSKLDREGTYEPIDGPMMAELAANAKDPITFATDPKVVRELAKDLGADVLIWGQLDNTSQGAVMRLNVLDLREPSPKPRELQQVIAQPTDLRFVSEEVLQTLRGIAPFEHPSEEPVQNDAEAEALWKKNPNLVVNGTFDEAGHWDGIYRSEKYAVKVGADLPASDKVVIYPLPEAAKPNNVLAMNLSKESAETNGLACLSEPMAIKPGKRYRLSFRYRSDGPKLHVFVKGYTMAEDIKGQKTQREIYRRQVPPTGDTNGKWVTVVDDLNPQQVAFEVQYLKIDLYAYLHPGLVMFDDIVLKEVGAQTRQARDEGIDLPVTRPQPRK